MAEARPFLLGPRRQISFAGHLVLKQIVLRHLFGMLARRARQTLVPFQRRQLSLHAFAVNGIKKQFLRFGNLLLAQARVCKKEYEGKCLHRPKRQTIPCHGRLLPFVVMERPSCSGLPDHQGLAAPPILIPAQCQPRPPVTRSMLSLLRFPRHGYKISRSLGPSLR